MGRRGPPPKRADKRLGHTSKAARSATTKADAGTVVPLEADESWHPVALQWFRSLALSGQSAFYTSGDWASAYVIAESMSREFSPQPLVTGRGADASVEMVLLPPKAASLAAWLKGMASLLVLEGDRRRVALELQRSTTDGEEASGDVSWIDDARTRLRDAN